MTHRMPTSTISLKLTAYVVLLMFAVALGTIPVVAQEVSGMLDDRIFVGSTGDKGKEASEADELRFTNGKFRSVDCDQWGFGDAPYTAGTDGDLIKFSAVTVSPEHGKIAWNGTVKGDTLEATYVWTKERWYWKDAHEEKWFKGSIKN